MSGHSQRLSTRRRLAGVACRIGLAVCILSGITVAQETPSDTSASQADTKPMKVVVGIDGHYRVGRPTAVRLIRPQADANDRRELSVETLDGEGVRVRFSPYPAADSLADPIDSPADSGDPQTATELGYVVAGSEAAPLRVVAGPDDNARDQVLVDTRFPLQGDPSRGPSLVEDGMPWVVSIGDPLGIDQIGVSNVLKDKQARVAVTKVASSSSLPYRSLGYSGVDLVMINASGLPVLRQMKPMQIDALTEWLQGGGRIFLCLGAASGEIEDAASWLIGLLPIDQVQVSRYDPAALETYTASQTPLSVFRGVRLPRGVGRVALSGRTTRRVSAVLAAEYTIGFGRATVVAADLDLPLFGQWPERLDLVTQLIGELLTETNANRELTDRSTSFNDLAGQMRGVLDQFSIKPTFSFSVVSLVLMLLIALVGPLDYLLINRVLRKPLLGWLTFPIVAIALSVVLVMQAAPKQDNSQSPSIGEPAAVAAMPHVRANQFQVTDIDLVDKTGRAFAWCSLYSHDPLEVNLSYGPSMGLWDLADPDEPQPSTYTYPMGFPGRAFGGAQRTGENTVLPMYSINPNFNGKVEGEGVVTTANGVTIAPRSSKSIASVTRFTPASRDDVSVARRPGSELLRGDLTNPLPVDLLDGMLVYGNWVYLLPTRVPSGTSVGNLNELRQKNFRWRLTRQQSGEESSTEITPWSPGDFSDAQRVAEMLMFHRAAGAELYTGLRHDVLGGLDLSESLVEGKCMLIGRTEQPLFDLKITPGEWASDQQVQPGGNVLSMVRVILPVRTTRLN